MMGKVNFWFLCFLFLVRFIEKKRVLMIIDDFFLDDDDDDDAVWV